MRKVGNDMNEATLAATMSAGKDAAARPLGFWMCTALVIGNTIGMGIFMQPAALAPFGYNALIIVPRSEVIDPTPNVDSLEDGLDRHEVEEAFARALDDVEQQIAEDKALGGPPQGTA